MLCVSLRVKININDIVSPLLSLYEEQAILRNSYAVNRGLNKLHFRTVNTMDNTIWRNFSDTAVRNWQFKLHWLTCPYPIPRSVSVLLIVLPLHHPSEKTNLILVGVNQHFSNFVWSKDHHKINASKSTRLLACIAHWWHKYLQTLKSSILCSDKPCHDIANLSSCHLLPLSGKHLLFERSRCHGLKTLDTALLWFMTLHMTSYYASMHERCNGCLLFWWSIGAADVHFHCFSPRLFSKRCITNNRQLTFSNHFKTICTLQYWS